MTPDYMLCNPTMYRALIREIYKHDPYARLLHLYNAGCRGAELR